MDYKEIIQFHLDKVKKKFDDSTRDSEKRYWKYIANQLILDYRDYVNRTSWGRTRVVDPLRFFEEFFRRGGLLG